jgi:flagellin-specific chaperone FliS
MTSNLAGLYHFCIRELTMAGHEGEVDRVNETLRITEELYRGFKAAFSGEG